MSGDKAPRPRGRMFFANPGPTNIPDSVLRAIATPVVDAHDPDFLNLYGECVRGLSTILNTKDQIFMYTGSGHAAWEAALVNLLSPGDTVLIVESGHFSEGWAKLARPLGFAVRTLPSEWRVGLDIALLTDALIADVNREIKAVCVVHNETSTGVCIPIQDVRSAMDEAGHEALLLVDAVSSLGCFDFRMDDWRVDVAVGSSQKGLMLPTGMALTGVSAKAMKASTTSTIRKHYLSWRHMASRPERSFVGTLPVNQLFGLRESLRLIEEEGLTEVFARHERLARGVRACVRHWAVNGGPQLYCSNPARESNSVTAVLVPTSQDADAIRLTCRTMFNVSVGSGLSTLRGRVFRIGHLGDLNEPMILGTLSSIEMALVVNSTPHNPGGVAAAMASLVGGPKSRAAT